MKSLRNLLRGRGLLGLLVLSAAGCGLSDYQSRMDAQRARVQKFDDGNLLLGAPIESPTIPGVGKKGSTKAWPVDFFLRLPKGYVEKQAYSTNFAFYCYSGSDADCNVFVAAAMMIDPALMKERYGEYSEARFLDLVRSGIDDYYFKKFPSNQAFHANRAKLFLPADKKSEPFEADLITPFSDVAVKIPYALTIFTDKENKLQPQPLEFRVYYHKEYGPEIVVAGKPVRQPGTQIAIVAQCPMGGSNSQFDKSIQAALGTLDLSTEVASKRAQYRRLKGS